MSEPQAVSPPPAVPEKTGGGFFQNLVDLYFAPRDAFTRIVRDPRWVLPALGYLALAIGFVILWMQRMDAMEFSKRVLEESPFWDRIPAEQRQQVIDQTAGRMKYAWINAIVGAGGFLLIASAVLLGIFRFFYAAEVRFKQALAISSWTMFAISLITTPLTWLILQLKGDWNVNPQEVVQANLGLLLDKSTAAPTLWALATSIDLFSIWMVFLLAAGFGVASRRSTGSAIWGVAIPWILIIAIKVGWAAIF